MTMTTHERPGVYSAYDASAVVSGSGGGKVVGLAALCTGAAVLQDFRDRYLLAFDGEWSVGFLTKHNEGLVLDDWLSV